MQLKKFYFFHTKVRNIDTVLDATTMSLYSFSIIQFYRFDNEFKVKVEAPVNRPNPKVVPVVPVNHGSSSPYHCGNEKLK